MIEFKNVSMAYPNASEYALKNISFSINNGEFVFLIGHSGSGKSTIIKLISCEEKPNAGSLIIDDINIHNLRQKMIPYLRRSIGMVFQDFRLIPSKTVYENIAFAMQILGHSKKQIKRRVSIVLSIVGLKDKEKMKPSELSGGEQQRVAIARAIVNNPMLLVADEPTGNLDPSNSESIMAILDEINRNGTTVIICTHDYNLVNRMQKRVIEIDHGRIIRDEVGSYYEKNEEASLVEESEANDALEKDDIDKKVADSSFKEGENAIRKPRISNLDLVFQESKIKNNTQTSIHDLELKEDIQDKVMQNEVVQNEVLQDEVFQMNDGEENYSQIFNEDEAKIDKKLGDEIEV